MDEFGLIAFGRSGNWELSINELNGESDEWCLEIESALVSLQCGIPDLNVVRDVERLLKSCDLEEREQIGSLQLGLYYGRPVRVTLDTKFSDRCFITIGDSIEGRFEVTLTGEDLSHFRKALSQVVSELERS